MNSTQENKSPVDLKALAPDRSISAIRKYALVAAGNTSLLNLLRHETILLCCTGLFGAAGIALRRLLYRYILEKVGRNVTIGRNVQLRGAGKIQIGSNVMIDDNCVLDARGEGTSIVIDDDVLISGATVIRARNALIHIGRGCSIGRNCLLGTDSRLILGSEVLLGAYTYLCAGGVHRFDGPEISVLSQGIDKSQGIEIGNGAWLGARTTVLDGASVGKGAVVGAHSLVTRSIPDMTVAFGSPAKVQRLRD
jgi:acetyltransferase-like isoleucine patch superfamily enzyme